LNLNNFKALIVQWQDLRLPREGPGFDSRLTHVYFFVCLFFLFIFVLFSFSQFTMSSNTFQETLTCLNNFGYYFSLNQSKVKVSLSRKLFKQSQQSALMITDLNTLPSPSHIPVLPLQSHTCQILFLCEDTLVAASQFRELSPAILVFSSDTNPGGGCKGNQQGTQEENICRRSTLQPVLETLNYPIPSMGIAYVPHIQVFRDTPQNNYNFLENPFEVGGICGAMRMLDDDNPKEKRKREQKIQLVFEVAKLYQHHSIILGAWGCGAFGNEVECVAKSFAKVIQQNEFDLSFKVIIFAVSSHKILKTFEKSFYEIYKTKTQK
jgi:uncharacterized protein (TIGR02452 family)